MERNSMGTVRVRVNSENVSTDIRRVRKKIKNMYGKQYGYGKNFKLGTENGTGIEKK